ncbi:single-stranded-DNA-specific exonuclease [Virgibacillus natechei]|uniref:Single-stranded-DNA-specific exonuclease RecJ n=1 Tax=Virgibacillus natechei TaxID=1216297 RepID=A0ABS4IE87_9BACI|nr:single-stranded-DNA-specific exonuclease RecJ [Virgibacillus natechei]MBP1968771.1 single-stranded-DNA-specific exonuclease [Virgibacillus natechei]UZD11571.1 single-stranded-DNA-specific exonuclease RecJ [Virgibacillus natechei]
MIKSKANWKFNTIQDNTLQGTDNLRSLSPVLKELLVQRGITTTESASTFLSPDIDDLQSPSSLDSIDKATERVHRAIADQEKILVYGDYDADGVSSTTVLLKALVELGADCDYYIPNRFTEGYGPNEEAFHEAYRNGFRLIITVDTGIAAVHEAAVAKELGIDLIITDHHEVQELPDAYAIIHPKCSPDYLFKDLAGVGIAFKFSEQLLGYFPEHLLGFTAIGTIADLVPLVDENRILAYYGLRSLTSTINPGLISLKRVSEIEGNVSEEDVGFSIGPRINAVGRLQNADLAVQLLMTEDQDEADEIAEEIHRINQERQKIVNDIVKEAEEMVETDEKQDVIIVAKEGWNEGVLGIVASKLVRKYDRPAIVLVVKPETSQLKGSARSIPAFDLFQNCMKIRDYFTNFGGHSQAAGMSIPLDNMKLIQNELNRLINEQLSEEDFKQVVEISKSLTIPEINEELVSEIDQLAPFGMKNPKPAFQIKEIPHDARQIGSLKNHLKLQFKQDNKSLEGIGFGMGDLYTHISPQTPISIVGELGINEWNGNKKPQIIMRDMKIEEWQLFDHRGKKHVDISSYERNNRNLIISNHTDQLSSMSEQISYNSTLSTVQEVDVLYIFDLPMDLNHLREIIKATKPVNIHACYYVEDSAYLKAFPSREEFKWFYAFIQKRKKVDLKQELTTIMKAKGWNKDNIIFISKVFFELGFVKIENGVIEINSNPVKRDLQDSRLYQERLLKADIEKTLYYSNYQELKQWFADCMSYLESPEEELTHGL